MDQLVTTALVGTARQEQINLVTDTPVDALIAGLPAEEREIERTFLLSAGARAIYHQAGKQAQQTDSAPEPAPVEQLRACSPGAALLLSQLMEHKQSSLLFLALERLRQHGLRLPFNLLPQALNSSNKETRAALFPALGERGRWLSQFNPSWQWVEQFLPVSTDELPSDAETIWQEGSLGQRAEILRRLRAIDPEKARAWLAGVWKQEKAEARSDLLASFEVGLSPADEAFLETTLDDRAASVRSTAAALLARLPDSAFGERMRQRAQDMVTRNGEKLAIKPPQDFPQDWLRDGVTEKSPQKVAPRAWWMIQVFSLVEPSFWGKHFNASPEKLLQMLAGDRWATEAIEGWSRAVINYRSPDWLLPLWSWWREHYQEALEKRHLVDYTYREQLLRIMPAPQAEQFMLEVMRDNKGSAYGDEWEMLLELPRPWSNDFAQTYLRLLRAHCNAERLSETNFNPHADPWLNNLPALAFALPATCLAEAARPWELPDTDTSTWQIHYVRSQIQEFTEIIHLRQKIDEEIF